MTKTQPKPHRAPPAAPSVSTTGTKQAPRDQLNKDDYLHHQNQNPQLTSFALDLRLLDNLLYLYIIFKAAINTDFIL